MRRWIERQWTGITVWHALLWPASLLFLGLSFVRRLAYRCGVFHVWRAPVPVIVVGNLTVGGTGKTPLVLWLAQFLRSQGFRPGIVSRGYRGKALAPHAVQAVDEPALVGDEPLLLTRRSGCPVWIGQRRPYVARALLQAHPECDVIISDDGLQHYAMARDVELAVVDGMRRYGNQMLLPAGPMREPLTRIKSLDAVIINGGVVGEGEYGMHLRAMGLRNLRDGSMAMPFDYLVDHHVHAVAGIGNPQRFFDQLAALGYRFTSHAFPDHHPYRAADFAFGDDRPVLMTEKDAVKCRAYAQNNWWYLEVDAQLEETFGQRILHKLRK